ncbi:MAG: hypothetical protein H6745_29260 [Deltaproteobacteria bacterium]|nr:hypothetical protein [Deltaproteobacteria bacterium]
MNTIHNIAAGALIAVLGLGLGACELLGEGAPKTVCESAQRRFQGCGVTAPLITDGPCQGLRRSVSMCIDDFAADCDDVRALVRRPDLCFTSLVDLPADGPPEGSDLFPEGPVGEPDAGGGDASSDGRGAEDADASTPFSGGDDDDAQ